MFDSERHIKSSSSKPILDQSAHSTSLEFMTKNELKSINAHLETLSPIEILKWSIDHLPNLYQITSFGLTGCAIIDMISKLSNPSSIPLIFIDTLYHFNQTYQTLSDLTEKYHFQLHRFYPNGSNNRKDFENLLGSNLWETDEATYGFLTKIEPARRAYEESGVKSVITGRRRSQGFERESIPILEIDETGLIKLNPLAKWDWHQTLKYIKDENVPYNRLIDLGFRSIGDWHSTVLPTKDDEFKEIVERSGRWSGSRKTECGLHQDYFKAKMKYEKSQIENKFKSRDLLRDEI